MDEMFFFTSCEVKNEYDLYLSFEKQHIIFLLLKNAFVSLYSISTASLLILIFLLRNPLFFLFPRLASW